ncbi:hypothetical protein HYR99_29700 [Candidatus Poribacteria bacterium]|nr:hypothetical protein [Candidatus Poribacteria bacterium]
MSSIAFNANGALFGSTIVSGSTSKLVQINPDTGSLISTIGDISIIDPLTGAATLVGNTGPDHSHPSDLDPSLPFR